jgi:hypothetical protein
VQIALSIQVPETRSALSHETPAPFAELLAGEAFFRKPIAERPHTTTSELDYPAGTSIRFLRGPGLFKLRSIRSGHERLITRASQNNYINFWIIIELTRDLGYRLSYAPRHRVPPIGLIERHSAYRAADFRQHAKECHRNSNGFIRC